MAAHEVSSTPNTMNSEYTTGSVHAFVFPPHWSGSSSDVVMHTHSTVPTQSSLSVKAGQESPQVYDGQGRRTASTSGRWSPGSAH